MTLRMICGPERYFFFNIPHQNHHFSASTAHFDIVIGVYLLLFSFRLYFREALHYKLLFRRL